MKINNYWGKMFAWVSIELQMVSQITGFGSYFWCVGNMSHMCMQYNNWFQTFQKYSYIPISVFAFAVSNYLHASLYTLTYSCYSALSKKLSKFPRYNTKCRGKRDTTRNIPHSISFPPQHFVLYLGKSITFGTVWAGWPVWSPGWSDAARAARGGQHTPLSMLVFIIL